jgi:hypothetical protein
VFRLRQFARTQLKSETRATFQFVLCSPGLQSGERVFKPARTRYISFGALQAAEKLWLLKGTGFSPYVTD